MFQKDPPTPRFHFISLRTHASSEWLAERSKRYRDVYDAAELTYIYASLSFHNLEFCRKEWEADITIRCHAIDSGWEVTGQVCELTKRVAVKPDTPIVTVHEGWGSPNVGGFWTPGTYLWVATIDGQEVGKAYFYLNSVGLVTPSVNPYFKLVSMRLFEDDNNPNSPANRRYCSAFRGIQTRYVWVEFTFENLSNDWGWMYELDFKYFTQARELKGRKVELNFVDQGQRYMTVVSGWGSPNAGTWHDGLFTAEVAFMGQIVAVLPFEVGPEFVADEGDGKQWQPWNLVYGPQGR